MAEAAEAVLVVAVLVELAALAVEAHIMVALPEVQVRQDKVMLEAQVRRTEVPGTLEVAEVELALRVLME